MMTVCVRQVTSVTEPLLTAFARLMPQLSPRLGMLPADRIGAVVASSSSAFFVAVAGDAVIGMLTLAWYDVPSGRKAWIEDVVVDEAARGVGAGEALVRRALEHAAAVGADRVLLTSNPSRQAARALYRKIGFEEAPTTVFSFKIVAK